MNTRRRWSTALALFSVALLPLWQGCKPRGSDIGKVPITTASDDAKREYLLGRECAEGARAREALIHFEAAIAKDSNFALAYISAANYAPNSETFLKYEKKAVALVDKVSKGEQWMIQAADAGLNNRVTKLKELRDSLVAAYPRDERVLADMAGYYYGRHEYPQAVEFFNKSIAIDSAYAPAYNLMGYSYKEMGRYPEAEAAFRKYIQLVPGDANPYDSYGELLLKLGRFDESIAQYEKALAIDSMFMSSHSGIAAGLMYAGKTEESHARLQKMHDIARDDAERRGALMAMAAHYVDCGKTDLALQELDKRFAIAEKRNDAAQMANDLESKGWVLYEAGKYPEAMAAFDRGALIVEKSSYPQSIKDYYAWNHHVQNAMVDMKRKDFKGAAAECDIVCKQAQLMAIPALLRGAHAVTGQLALEKKQYDKAIEEFKQVDMASPYNLYQLSLAYMGKGDKVNAKECCAKAAHSYAVMDLGFSGIRGKAEKMLLTL